MFVFPLTAQILQWLCLCVKTESSIPIQALLGLCLHLYVIQRSRGTVWTILYCKAVRGNLFNYFSQNILNNDPLAKTTKDGIPVILGDLIPYIRNRSYIVISMIFTVLMATRALSVGKEPNIESIIAPATMQPHKLDKNMELFWRVLGYRPATRGKPRSLLGNLIDFRVKSGPNGHALNSCHIDAQMIPDSLLDSLIILGGQKFRVIKKLKEAVFFPFFDHVGYIWKTSFRQTNLAEWSIRRLSYFGDKENKVRVIALFDYFSQLALKPLYKYLENTLKRIPQDCTLDQAKFIKLLNLKDGNSYHSIDLSNATDRFPISLQIQLLKKQLPDNYVDAWRDVMVGYPFLYEKDGDSTTVNYSVGTPMGAYTSFHAFALTHHFLIFHCCVELGLVWKDLPYSILGDDIVICNDKVAVMYKELLQVLGVGVSEAKTHSSLHFYEFAKRIFLDELEISPFPVSAIFECGKSSVMMTTLLNTLVDKGWVFTDIPSSVGIFYGVLRQRSSSFKKEVRNMSYLFEGVLKTIQAKIPITEFINELCKKYNWPSHLGEEACKSILNQIALKSFLKTNKIDLTLFDPILDVPLGALSTRIVSEWPMFIKKYYNGNIPHHIATFQPTFDLPLLW